MLNRVVFTLFLVGILSCSGDKEELPEPVVDIQKEYQDIVQLFLEEAQTRGITIFIDNLIVQSASDNISVCASCNSLDIESKIQKLITIKPTACWDNPEQREALIFHELGHCVLGRSHNTETLPNGDPKSLMVSGNIGVYSPCNYAIDEEDCNFLHKRSYYIDELFNESTPAPDWAK
jgi:hypothetical protein